ncbi:MAG: hypothetical protein JWR16_2548 [Nevskia sp.]|nr:hypothetical protein [Nevskia sp.]
MCLIAFAWNVHPQWPLVLVANRDEQHARPSAALAAWSDDATRPGPAPKIYGGRDLRAGGGWLALNPSQRRLAAVTNFREPALDSGARSRGALVQAFASSADGASGFADRLALDAAAYGPFNLLLWDGAELVYASNRPAPRWQSVPAGLHGLSNSTLDTRWPKVERLSTALQAWLPQLPTGGSLPPATAVEPLLQALADDHIAGDAELPDTGVGIDLERLLSPPFIRGETYGTRASSVVLIARSGAALFIERRFGPAGVQSGDTALELQG